MRKPLLCADLKVDNDLPLDMVRCVDNSESRLSRLRALLSSPLNKRRSSTTVVDSRVFGVPLSEIRDKRTDGVPIVVVNVCHHISSTGYNVEGLFRISGSRVSVDRVKSVVESCPRSPLSPDTDVLAAASLLKCFLRELPDALIPSPLSQQLIHVMKEESAAMVVSLSRLVHTLPGDNLALLNYIIQFLQRMAKHVHATRMGPSALGIVFGPNLFRAREDVQGIQDQYITNKIVTLFIQNYSSIFQKDSPEKLTPRCNSAKEEKQSSRRLKKRKEISCDNAALALTVDLKIIRSSSEERLVKPVDGVIRRVNSHGNMSALSSPDTDKYTQVEEMCSPLSEINIPLFQQGSIEPDCRVTNYTTEPESRIASYPRTLGIKKRKRTFSLDEVGSAESKENAMPGVYSCYDSNSLDSSSTSDTDYTPHELEYIPLEAQDSSPSPEKSGSSNWSVPPLDLATLHHNREGTEPITSQAGSWNFRDSNMLLSTDCPRISESGILESPKENSDNALPSSSNNNLTKIKRLNRKIRSYKQQLRKYEECFSMSNGYHPSHQEKCTDVDMREVISQIHTCKKELKALKEGSSSVESMAYSPAACESTSSRDHTEKSQTLQSLEDMKDTLHIVQKMLSDNRISCGRSDVLEDLNKMEIMEEKLCIQRALLYFESRHGRPQQPEVRNLVRPFYDRYRLVKRMVLKSSSPKSKESMELESIPEHEPAKFTPQPEITSETTESSKYCGGGGAAAAQSSTSSRYEENIAGTLLGDVMTRATQSDSLGDKLHELPRFELVEALRAYREEKKQIGRKLKEWEEEFFQLQGRKVSKDDREPMDDLYQQYKQVKARVKFINALINKSSSDYNRLRY